MLSWFGQNLMKASNISNMFLGYEKLHFKCLSTERDFQLLQSIFADADGIRLPIDYLQKGRAYICFNDHLEAQGGFALIDQGPYRTLEQIPADSIRTVETELTEITAVCLSSGGSLRRLRYWSYMIGATLTGPTHQLVYSVDVDKSPLRERIFNHIRTHTLYEGPVKQLAGMSSIAHEAVELTSKTHLAKGFLKLAFLETGKANPALAVRYYLSPRIGLGVQKLRSLALW